METSSRVDVALVSDEDIPTFVEVMSKAFGHNAPFVDIYFPNHDTLAGQAQLSKRFTAWKQSSESSTFLKAVTRTGEADQEKIIGIAIWTLMKEPPPSALAEAENVEEVWPNADDREFMTQLWREYVIPRTQSIKDSEGKGVYALELLAVHPNHRRLGAGRALVEWGTKASDKEGVKAIVEGTPIGRRLYEQCGLSVQIEQMRFDLEDLVSHGCIIVAIDITYEAIGVDFPDGRLLPSNILANATLEYVELVLKTRVEDAKFVLDSLKDPNTVESIPGLAKLGKKLQADTAAIFGHSFGGATAAQAVAEYSSFTCGVNIDDSILGSVAGTGLEGPFVQVASQIHNRSSDATWAQLWENLDGFKREFNVHGTVHESFEDATLYHDAFGTKVPMGQGDIWGSINGNRLVQIETGLMSSFFGFCLKGQDASELDRLVEYKFP